jgi:hypothetical protein
MSNKASTFWLFFLFNLPGNRASERVKFWRRLKKFGAVQLKTSAYVLPDEPTHYERFQWLSKEIVDVGGDATLARIAELENMPNAAVVSLFNDARSKDYNEIAEPLLGLIKDRKARKANPDAFLNQLQKLKARFQEIQEIDYFRCPRAEDLQMLFQKVDALESPTKQLQDGKRLQAADYNGKLWLTRPRPEIDRVGSAWLIRKFIDSEAKFVFADTPTGHREAIPYDMLDVEFSHHGEFCTFETLLDRFGIRDRAVLRIAELIHDADLEDNKFHRVEGFGVERVFKGWAKQGLSDQEIIAKGFLCFDGLYAEFKRS